MIPYRPGPPLDEEMAKRLRAEHSLGLRRGIIATLIVVSPLTLLWVPPMPAVSDYALAAEAAMSVWKTAASDVLEKAREGELEKAREGERQAELMAHECARESAALQVQVDQLETRDAGR